MSEACDAVTDYAFGPLGFGGSFNARRHPLAHKGGAPHTRGARSIRRSLTARYGVWELRAQGGAMRS